MGKIDDQAIIEVIQSALNIKGNSFTIDSSMKDVEGWDSLGHLGVLVALDRFFDGKVGSIREMATADSVRKILQILKDNFLM